MKLHQLPEDVKIVLSFLYSLDGRLFDELGRTRVIVKNVLSLLEKEIPSEVHSRSELRQEAKGLQSSTSVEGRSELRQEARGLRIEISGVELLGMDLPPNFNERWVTVIAVCGIDYEIKRASLEGLIIGIVARGQDPEKIANERMALQDPLRDGKGIARGQKTGLSPVLLQVDARALDPKDKESIAARLAFLPDGSVIIEYADPAAGNILSLLMGRFPKLHYIRKAYRPGLRFETVRQELVRRAKEYGIDPENAGFLTSDPRLVNGENKRPSLGIIFLFDPAKLPPHARLLKGITGAVFGEFAHRVANPLDQSLADALANGCYQYREGVYSLNFAPWLEHRTAEHLASSA